jgi:hypothetical protein
MLFLEGWRCQQSINRMTETRESGGEVAIGGSKHRTARTVASSQPAGCCVQNTVLRSFQSPLRYSSKSERHGSGSGQKYWVTGNDMDRSPQEGSSRVRREKATAGQKSKSGGPRPSEGPHSLAMRPWQGTCLLGAHELICKVTSAHCSGFPLSLDRGSSCPRSKLVFILQNQSLIALGPEHARQERTNLSLCLFVKNLG